MNRIKTIKSRESEKFLYEIEQTIRDIEDQGKALGQRKNQQVWFIDEDRGKILKLLQKLEYSEEKGAILEKEVELLWKKVSVYEHYGDSERKLRDKAIEALN